MTASSADRRRLQAERIMGLYQPALDASLEAIPDGQAIRFDGLAHVGNCDSYYLITVAGVHYCDQEKAGMFKKQYVPRFCSLDAVDSLDVETKGPNAYIRFRGGGRTHLTMWFRDELSEFRGMSAEAEAMRFASAFGA